MGLNLDVLLGAINNTYTNVIKNQKEAMATAYQQDLEASKFNRDVVQYNRSLEENRRQFDTSQESAESRFAREQAQQDKQFADTKKMQAEQFDKSFSLDKKRTEASVAGAMANIRESEANTKRINQAYEEGVYNLQLKKKADEILMKSYAPIEALNQYRDQQIMVYKNQGYTDLESKYRAELDTNERRKELMPEKPQEPDKTFVEYKTPDGRTYNMSMTDKSKADADIYKETALAPLKAKTEKPEKPEKPSTEVLNGLGYFSAQDPAFASKIEKLLSTGSPFKTQAESMLNMIGSYKTDGEVTESYLANVQRATKSLNDMVAQVEAEQATRINEANMQQAQQFISVPANAEKIGMLFKSLGQAAKIQKERQAAIDKNIPGTTSGTVPLSGSQIKETFKNIFKSSGAPQGGSSKTANK